MIIIYSETAFNKALKFWNFLFSFYFSKQKKQRR